MKLHASRWSPRSYHNVFHLRWQLRFFIAFRYNGIFIFSKFILTFTMEKQVNHSIAFRDVFISGIVNPNLTLQTYHQSTYMGVLLNFKSLTSFSCKITLIKCSVDRPFKICNNWTSFHNDIENIKFNFIKNAYRPILIDKVIKNYLSHEFSSNKNQLKDTSDVRYFKLPYIGNLLTILKANFRNFAKIFVKKILTLS